MKNAESRPRVCVFGEKIVLSVPFAAGQRIFHHLFQCLHQAVHGMRRESCVRPMREEREGKWAEGAQGAASSRQDPRVWI